jgi:hypothetical protein
MNAPIAVHVSRNVPLPQFLPETVCMSSMKTFALTASATMTKLPALQSALLTASSRFNSRIGRLGDTAFPDRCTTRSVRFFLPSPHYFSASHYSIYPTHFRTENHGLNPSRFSSAMQPMICRHLNKPNPAAAYAEALWRHFKKKMDRIEAGRMNL